MARPNILLITADQWRGDCLGHMGHAVLRTPHVDALAGRGVSFARHYAPCAPCSPARASLYTGLYQMNHRVVGNGAPLDDRFDNIARAGRRVGYLPTLFGYTDTAPDPRGRVPADPDLTSYEGTLPGFAMGQPLREDDKPWITWLRKRGHGDEVLADPHRVAGEEGEAVSRAPTAYGADETQTAFLVERFGDWLGEQEGAWFAHLSFLRPHPPFVVPAPYNDMYDPGAVPPSIGALGDDVRDAHPLVAALRHQQPASNYQPGMPGVVGALEERDFARLRAVYYGLISEVDAQIGRLMDMLAAAGELENTLVILTSDHGEMMGDHGLLGKGGFYPQSQHIPLIVAGPGVAEGEIVRAFTSPVDVFPTLLETFDTAPGHGPDGTSLWPLLRGERPEGWRDGVIWEFDFRGLLTPEARRAMGLGTTDCGLICRMTDAALYVQARAFDALLFDLQADPDCLIDVADDDRALRLEAAEALIRARMALNDNTLADTVLTPQGPVRRN